MSFDDSKSGARSVGGWKLRAKGLVAVTVIGALSTTALTPALAATTLEQALVRAYQTNPQLLGEQARLRATDEGVSQAISGWRPTISLSGNYSYSYQDSETDSTTFTRDGDPATPPTGSPRLSLNDTESTGYGAGVTISQNIFRGFRTWNSLKQAMANVEAGRAQLTSVEQEVLLNTVTAYMNVLRDEAVVQLSENNVTVLTRQLEAAEDRFKVGEITRTDVAQAEARLSASKTNLTNSQAQLTASRELFKRVVGIAPEDLQAPPQLPTLPESEQAALTIALRNNPSLNSARKSEEASRRAVDVARGQLLPTLTIEASYSYSNSDSSSDRPSTAGPTFDPVTGQLLNGDTVTNSESESDSYQVLGRVTVPLYAAGSTSSQIRQAKQQNSQARLQIAQTQRAVSEQVANAWEQMRSARATIVSSREQVRANEIAFEGVKQEAQVGSRTTLDVLDAEQELLNSRVQLVQAQRDEYVAAYTLLAAIGQLTARDLELPTQVYDPTENYNDVKWRPYGWWVQHEPSSIPAP